jgi:hypothetical protein
MRYDISLSDAGLPCALTHYPHKTGGMPIDIFVPYVFLWLILRVEVMLTQQSCTRAIPPFMPDSFWIQVFLFFYVRFKEILMRVDSEDMLSLQAGSFHTLILLDSIPLMNSFSRFNSRPCCSTTARTTSTMETIPAIVPSMTGTCRMWLSEIKILISFHHDIIKFNKKL